MGLFQPRWKLIGEDLRTPLTLLRRRPLTRWIFRVRWFRVGVILFCLSFWVAAGFGCRALLAAMRG